MTGAQPDRDESMVLYAVGEDWIRDRGLAEQAGQAVLTVLRPRAARAVIDAYTDYRKTLTPEARAAEDALAAKGALRRTRDPGMNVALDLSSETDWAMLSCYGPWSINVDIYDGTGAGIGSLHDCGHVITAALTAAEAAQLAGELGDAVPIEKLERPPTRPPRKPRKPRPVGRSPRPGLFVLGPKRWQRRVWRWPVVTPPTVPPTEPPTFSEPRPTRDQNDS